ncbi:MAG: hypothetical protein ABI401_08300 [Candidatus Dormibacter sp.]
MQPTAGAEAADGYRDRLRHSRPDAAIQQDTAAGELADILQVRRPALAAPAPTDPEVTDVTPASTASISKGENERIATGVEVEPPASLLIQGDRK